MMFEEWWKLRRETPFALVQLPAAKEAWYAAIKAERQRCREIVKEVASASSIIGIGVANQIAEKIGDD